MPKLGLGFSASKQALTTPGVITTNRTVWAPFDSSGQTGTAYTGQALEFDGVSDYISADVLDIDVDTENWTISCWINITAYAANSAYVNVWGNAKDASNRIGIQAYDQDSDSPKLAFVTYNGAYVSTASDAELDKDTWYYITATCESNTLKLYIDGTLQSGSTVATSITNTVKCVVGGNSAGGSVFNGKISNFQVWNALWSASDIAYAYANPEQLASSNSGTSLTYSDLKLWYPMQDGHKGNQSVLMDGANTGGTKNPGTSVFYGDDEASGGGDFDATTNWSVVSGSLDTQWAIGSSKATHTDDNTNTLRYTGSSNTIRNGATYRVEFVVADRSAGTFTVSVGGGAASAAQSATGNVEVIGGGTSARVLDIAPSSDFDGSVDSVYVKEVGFASGWSDADVQATIPQLAFQSYNQLAWFDGVADYVNVSDNAALDVGTGDFSISLWVSTKGTAISRLVDKNGYNAYSVYLQSDGTIKISIHNTATSIATITFNDGKWHHIVASFDRDANCTVYKNGESIGTIDISSDTEDLGNANALRFGASTTSTLYPFEGSMTEISLWKGEALTSAKVQELYNDGEALDATLHSSVANLSGYWRNNSKNDWLDLSSNSNDGSPQSMAEYLILPEGQNGRDTQGFLMNKVRTSGLNHTDDSSLNSYVDLGSTTTIAAGTAYSIMAWLKPSYLSNNHFIGDSSNDFLKIASSTTLALLHNNTNISGTDASNVFTIENGAGGALVVDTWYHIAFVRNTSNVVTVYVNGLVNGGADEDTGTIAEPFDYRYLGSRNTIYHFGGACDDFAIYSTELEAPQILRNYNAGKRRHQN